MATKKISELPLVNRVSGSQVAGGSVLPIVIGGGIQGTTNQISVEDFSLFVNAYNATTGSNTFIGNQTVTGNVSVSGRLTVNELVAQYETSSILFSTGSTKLGDQLTDKHEFTGSTNLTGSLTATGFITLNGQSLNNAFDRIHQTTHSLQLATSSLQAHSASVDNQLARVYQTTQSLHVATASLQAFSSSVNDQLQKVYQTTQSLHVATASLQFHSASVDAQLLAIQQTTQSLQVATASLNAFTASQDGRNFIISEFTSSTNAHIVGISDFTSSQLAVNLGNSIYTASVDSHIVGISTYTSSVRDTLARVHQATQSLQVATASLNAFTASQDSRNFVISQFTASTNNHIVGISTFTSSILAQNAGVASVTASLNAFTASQDSRNFVVSQVTGSLIGITNGLMAFTAALDNTYATDAQLYQLYQATRSIELTTGSLIGITNGLMAYTSSNETWKTGVRGEISAIEAWTASLDNTYATDAQLYQLYAATASINTTTGSLKGEIAGLEAYTASLKSAAIVSSSQQITNYYKFAETASANTFYGTQTVTGNIVGQADVQANKFVFTDGVVNTNVGGQKILATNTNILYLYSGTSGIYINNQANDTTIAQFTNGGQLTIGGPGNDQNLIFGGTNSSIYWGVGGPARMYYNVGDIKISSNGASDVLTVKNIGGISVSGGITGSLMATNGVISGSVQLTEIAGIEAYTASLKGAIVVDGTNVEVLGTLTAQEIHTTYVTSSVLFQSGSTKFGNSSDDKHEFTGSLNVGSTGHSYINIDAANASAFESGIYHKIGGVNKWEQYTAANDGNLNWYSQGNGIQFKIYPTEGASFTGHVTASQNLRVTGKTQIGTSTVDTSLGSKTKLSVVGDGNVNAGASQGSLFVAAGNEGGDTGLPINMGTAGATMMLLASINTGTGTSTNSATYIVRFYFDGNNAPTTTYLGGSSDFVTFGVTPSNTLAVSGSSSGNKSYAWFINKFGA